MRFERGLCPYPPIFKMAIVGCPCAGLLKTVAKKDPEEHEVMFPAEGARWRSFARISARGRLGMLAAS